MSDEDFTTPPSGPETNLPPAPEPAWTQAPPPPPGYTQTAYTPPPQPGYAPPSVDAGLSDTAASALAYVTFIPAILFLVLAPYNQKPVIKFHAIQELCISVILFILSFFLVIPILGLLVYAIGGIILLVVWVLCIIKASQGNAFVLPFIGKFAAEQSGYRI